MGFYKKDIVTVNLEDSINIIHKSELTDLKKYWKELPWYETEISDEALIVKDRIKKLVDDFGIEKKGMARCCNPECDRANIEILKKKPDYVNIYK